MNYKLQLTSSDQARPAEQPFLLGKGSFSVPIPSTGWAFPNLLVGSGLSTGFVNKYNKFRVDKLKLGRGDVSVNIVGPSDVEIIAKEMNGFYHFAYVVTSPGLYVIDCLFRNEHFGGSPFKAKIADHDVPAANVVATGDGLRKCRPGEVAKFWVTPSATCNGDIVVVVFGDLHHDIVMYYQEEKFWVEYMPQRIGWYEIQIHFEGIQIPSSPFLAICKGGENVSGSNNVVGIELEQYDDPRTEEDYFWNIYMQ